MTSFLLTWNRSQFPWDDLPEVVSQVAAGESVPVRWSTGVRRSLPIGSRVYLMHLGREPRGIVASGVTTSEPFESEHWDSAGTEIGRTAWYTLFAPELLIDPDQRSPLDPRQSPSDVVRNHDWTPQSSGTSIPEDVSNAILREWFEFCSSGASSLGEADTELSALEGVERVRLVRHRSRERALRSAKVAEVRSRDGGRLMCEVPRCGFDFEEKYGERGKNFAEVHHLNLLAESGVVQTRLSDLRVVCSNCHRVIHRVSPMADFETLIPVDT